ncbi:MAG: sulfurtransferase TusA family protein [Halobacteriaceae archaeon]
MSMDVDVSQTLDVKGASCPMPVVKTRQHIDDLDAGEVLEVVATDSGSMSDIEGWAETAAGVELLGQEEGVDGGETVYRHFVRKA